MTVVGARPERAPPMTRLPVRRPGIPGGRTAARWPWLLVAAAVAWNLASLRALTIEVPYLNDGSLHEQMVRFAMAQLRAGHLPLTSWFPFLGGGSPQFLHYQSLPAILTGALGLLTGPDVAFRWSLYLLLSLWPISVYLSARWFGAGRPAAAASAAMAPFLVSATGVGYEQHAYVWSGFGVWTQLWAMWTLPLAWGLSWRAIRDGRGYLGAVLLTSLTVALHFETGYLALLVLLAWPLVAGRPFAARLRRGALLLGGSLLASAWVIVPLVAQRPWAAVNEAVQDTPLVNGYGARQVLDWLLSGQLLDHGRLPVVTAFAALGLGLAWLAWSADTDARALLVALAACLLFAFGRTTFGTLANLIPGSADLFFRRFMMGVQLAALLLAGRGAAWLAARGVRLLEARVSRWPPGLSAAAVLVVAIAVLAPAWLQLAAYDRHDGAAIAAQHRADDTDGVALAWLISTVERDGGGRTYAGMASNWGHEFTVGAMPVFKYLESRDVDEVGYTLRTASLMTNPEYYFDERNPSDYRLFGIHYLIIPTGSIPPVPARLELRAGPYTLWTLPGPGGLLHAGTIVGRLTANRADIGTRSIPLLNARLAQAGGYLRVAYDRPVGRELPPPPPSAVMPAGMLTAEFDALEQGRAAATVRMRRTGVIVLSASFDPGWTATVDGHRRRTEMVAPALVATTVPAGTHRIIFRYRGWPDYPLLFALGAATLLALAYADIATGAIRRHRRSACMPWRGPIGSARSRATPRIGGRMAIDASGLLGAPQIAGVKVMARGATMGRAWNQGGVAVGGVIGAAGGALASGKASKKGSAGRAETPEFKGQALLALTDDEVALIKLKQGAVSAKPTEVIARAPRDQVAEATLSSGLVPKLSISFADGSAWSMDVPRVVKKQGDTNRIVELLRA